MFKKIAATVMTAAIISVPMAGVASARPCAGGGVCTGAKELCKTQTNWVERYILQQGDHKWVLCKSLR